MSGESPSPFVLTAPLMPPCAQTEWLRLTGTIEKRSTETPTAATRIAAIRPARPPPTTTTRSLINDLLHPKRGDRPQADHRQDDEDGRRHGRHALLGPRAARQAPPDRERPEAVAQVERRGEDARDVEGVEPGVRDCRPDQVEEIQG